MATSYPRIAGQSLERLSGLSDGIFAVAMTLLVLDLRVPFADVVHGEHPLWTHGSFASERDALEALAHIAPRVLPYVMSFMTLGIFWVGQQTQFNHFVHADRLRSAAAGGPRHVDHANAQVKRLQASQTNENA